MDEKLIEKASALLRAKAEQAYEEAKREWKKDIIFFIFSVILLLLSVVGGALLLSFTNLFPNPSVPKIISPILLGLSVFFGLCSFRFYALQQEAKKKMKEAASLLRPR